MIRYVFFAATGRCGTAYLAHLLDAHPDIVARHEPKPDLQGEPMRAWNEGRPEALRALIPEKFAAIEAARGGGNRVYVETSNAFLKGFGWELLRGGYIAPDETLLIHLTRRWDRKRWVESLRAANFGTDMYWSILPTDAEAVWFGEYADVCEWYIDEIAARYQAMSSEFPDLHTWHVDIGSLNAWNGVDVLLARIGVGHSYMQLPEALLARIGTVVNEGLPR